MRTRSMAPGAARWPPDIWAPSKAGPVGEVKLERYGADFLAVIAENASE